MITQDVCNSYKEEIFSGLHTAEHVYKLALYTHLALLNSDTTVYTTDSEVVGTGYVAGGKVLSGFFVQTIDRKVYLSFDPAVWDPSTISARGALLYNSTAENRAVVALDFGVTEMSVSGPFSVDLSQLIALGPPRRLIGNGSPEGVERAEPGTTYWDKLNKSDWVKETGTDEFGWYNKFGPES